MDSSKSSDSPRDSSPDSSREAGSQRKEELNPGPQMPNFQVMRGRLMFGLALGIIGVCLGVLSAVLSSGMLAILAGVAVISGGACLCWGALVGISRGENMPAIQERIDAVTVMPGAEAIEASLSQTVANLDRSVIDPLTELPDGRFFEVAVEGRVAAARRHLWPVSIVILQLGFDPANNAHEDRNRSIAGFSNIMRQTLREADIACRLDESTFGLILEDTSEEGGVWTAERLQIALSHENTVIRRLVAGVAAYPTHGLYSKDVLVRAKAALHRAASTPNGHGLGQVEVAHVDLS